MGAETGISWTDHTFNPWWGCVKISSGCRNCYATSLASRYGHDVWGTKKPRRFFGDKHWQDPAKWDRLAEAGVPGVRGIGRHLVFSASMADVFEDYRGPDAKRLESERSRLLGTLVQDTPFLDWQLLTKRPQNVPNMVPWWGEPWPSNVWIGTSVEDQRRADERIESLLRLNAPVRFLSVEPMLGPVDLTDWLPELDWVIVGGESGSKHRPFDPQWARDLRDQCAAASVAFFFKQHGGRTPTAGGHLLDGQEHHDFPGAGREGNV